MNKKKSLEVNTQEKQHDGHHFILIISTSTQNKQDHFRLALNLWRSHSVMVQKVKGGA